MQIYMKNLNSLRFKFFSVVTVKIIFLDMAKSSLVDELRSDVSGESINIYPNTLRLIPRYHLIKSARLL